MGCRAWGDWGAVVGEGVEVELRNVSVEGSGNSTGRGVTMGVGEEALQVGKGKW